MLATTLPWQDDTATYASRIHSLTSKTQSLFSATVWTIAARWTDRGLGLVSIALLSRLLTPEQFGLVATASIVVVGIEMFFSFGFDWVLVRLPTMTSGHMSTAWTLRVILGAICGLLLGALSTAISSYFGDSRIAAIVLVLAAAVVVGSLENPAMADFRRRLDFRAEYVVTLGSKISGFVVAATLAFAYRTYWALPLAILVSRTTTVALSYAMHPFRPRWRLDERSELMNFSIWQMVNTVINFFRTKSAELVVARQLGLHSLGLLRIANELAETAANELGGPMNRALFSDYSRKSQDVRELRESYVRTTSMVWCVALPVALGIALLAPHAVRIIFGTQWGESADLVGILCVANALGVMSSNAGSVLWSLGLASIVVYLSAAMLALFLVAVVVLVPMFALPGATYAMLLTAIVSLPLTVALTCRRIDLGFREFMTGKWRLLFALLAMCALVIYLRQDTLPTDMPSVFAETAILAAAGAACYTAVIAGLWVLAGRPSGAEQIILDNVISRIFDLRHRKSEASD